MPTHSALYVYNSGMIVSGIISASPRRSSLKLLPSRAPTASTATCEPELLRNLRLLLTLQPSSLRTIIWFLVLHQTLFFAYVTQICDSGCVDENGATDGLGRSAEEGHNAGASGFGARESPEQAAVQGFKRKRGWRGPSQPSKPTSTKQSTPNFACHFYLHDRIGHSDCLAISLKRISDVRQHLLERAHYQVAYCPNCGTTFPGRPAEARPQRNAHIQAATCEHSQPAPDYPGITEDQDRRIRSIAHTSRGNQHSQVRRWYDIWDCLFPGEAHPPSPFLDELPEIQRMVDWRNIIFDNDSSLWRELPAVPWTQAMGLEEQRAAMSNFIGSFILISRRLMRQDASPVEDHHGVDDSSYLDGNMPPSSSASASIELPSLVSFDSNGPGIEPRRAYLSPTFVTGAQQSQETVRARPSEGDHRVGNGTRSEAHTSAESVVTSTTNMISRTSVTADHDIPDLQHGLLHFGWEPWPETLHSGIRNHLESSTDEVPSGDSLIPLRPPNVPLENTARDAQQYVSSEPVANLPEQDISITPVCSVDLDVRGPTAIVSPSPSADDEK